MQTLIQLLEARKAKTLAWIAEDPDNRWASYPVQELEHWHGYGIHTAEQFVAYEMRAQLYDLYKDVHGVRPRHLNMEKMSDEEIQLETDSLFAAMDEEEEHKRLSDMSWQDHLSAYNERHVDVSQSPFAVLQG